MQITLERNFVSSLSIKKIPEADINENKIFDLSVSGKSDDSNKREFYIVFEVLITDSQSYKIEIEYVSVFSTEEDVNEEFMTSPFVKINAPAIGYPFLRSFISLLTVNAGYNPAILPTINFVELSKKQSEKK